MKNPLFSGYVMTLLFVCWLLPMDSLFSQAPQGLNYQAVVRNNSGSIMQSQHISVRFTIRDNQNGPILYQEIQNAITNEFGLITLYAGKGIAVSGVFADIEWPTVTAWLQVEMDVSGGTSYEDMGTSPLLSVPYALFAAKSGGESVWDTNGTAIYFNNNVGIGTEDPASPLTIETGINEVGFTHKTHAGVSALSTSITDIGAAIGTTSNDVFSLTAGGTGKVHIWPDGRVVMGEDANPNDVAGDNPSRLTPIVSKLTVETPINSTGFLHIGGADSIIVQEAIGGVSAALGVVTNHAFRLFAGPLGKIQIHPDGNVVVGANNDAAIGRFTVHTPNNSDGISHVSDGGVILKTRIGGVSAGFGTFSNHMMRIFSNSVAVINIDPAGNIGIGTPDPLPGYRLSVNGNMKAKELVIETVGWPDYVFEDSYQPLSLREIEKFIQQYHHLPNMPSASELEKYGIAVGEMQKMMMEKIEELTLYLIQQQKTIEELQSTITELKK